MADYRATDDGGDRVRARARQGDHTGGSPMPSMGDQLGTLCASVTAELDLLGAFITLMSESGDAIAAGSSPRTRVLEELQVAGGEGPTRDAFAGGRPVLVSDLPGAMARWPGFARDAVAAGLCAVYAIPLQLGATRFGVLTCCSGEGRVLTSAETSQLLIYGEVATDLLLDGSGSGGTVDDLVASGFRAEVFQAQGMVAVDLGVGLADALSRMRAAAFLDGTSLQLLAGTIVADGRRLPPASTDERPPGGA